MKVKERKWKRIDTAGGYPAARFIIFGPRLLSTLKSQRERLIFMMVYLLQLLRERCSPTYFLELNFLPHFGQLYVCGSWMAPMCCLSPCLVLKQTLLMNRGGTWEKDISEKNYWDLNIKIAFFLGRHQADQNKIYLIMN